MSRQVSGSDMSRWQTFTDMVRAAAEPLTKVDGFLACKPGISMPGLHALFFVDYSRYMVSS